MKFLVCPEPATSTMEALVWIPPGSDPDPTTGDK